MLTAQEAKDLMPGNHSSFERVMSNITDDIAKTARMGYGGILNVSPLGFKEYRYKIADKLESLGFRVLLRPDHINVYWYDRTA